MNLSESPDTLAGFPRLPSKDRRKERMMTFIYALLDPITLEIRYIGKADDPKFRLGRHLRENSGGTHKVRWIKKLKSLDLIPELMVIERVSKVCWQERERFWVNHFRGPRLTNSIDGGIGGNNPSEETRRLMSLNSRMKDAEVRTKISAAKKGIKLGPMSEQNKKAISQALTGRILNDLWKQKLSENNAMHNDPEVRWKVAAKNRGSHHTDEAKAKISKSNKGRICSEEIKATLSALRTGNGNPMYGRSGEMSPTYGTKRTLEQLQRIALAVRVANLKSGMASSRFIGVHWNKQSQKWMVRIRNKYIGLFSSEMAAAEAYNRAAIQEYGEIAVLNDLSI